MYSQTISLTMYYKHLRVHKGDVHQLILTIDKNKN